MSTTYHHHHNKQNKLKRRMSIMWLIALYLVHSTCMYALQYPLNVNTALLALNCQEIHEIAADQFTNQSRIEDKISQWMNEYGMKSNQHVKCLQSIFDAYYKVVLRPRWVPNYNAYRGRLDEPGKITAYSPIPRWPHGVRHSGKSEQLQICGQSKQALSAVQHLARQSVMNIGEDAVGRSKDGRLFIVADGVGGASHSEIVSMSMAYVVVKLYDDGLLPDLLANGQSLITAMQSMLGTLSLSGSSTLTIAQKAGGHVNILHIGDCSVAVINKQTGCKFVTEEQWFAPNTPYQLNASPSLFDPQLAAYYRVPLSAGDVILLYSDGIGDNVWLKQLEEVVTMGGGAVDILALARQQAKGSVGTDIPFARKMGMRLAGKMDDMSVMYISN